MPEPIMWRELVFPRPLAAEQAVEGVRAVAADPYGPRVTLEARGNKDGVRFLLGTHPAAMNRTNAALGATAVALSAPRLPVVTARKVMVSSRRRALVTNVLPLSAKAILAALNTCGTGEELVLQVVLGPRLSGQVVPSTATTPVPVRRLLVGNGDGRLDTEARSALARKVEEPGYASMVRVAVAAGTAARRRDLLLGLLGALRRLEAPNVNVYLANAKPEHVDDAKSPFRWPLRLNVAEVAAITGLPVGDGDLPGLASRHPKPLVPVVGPFAASKDRLVVAKATAPGITAPGSPEGTNEPVLTISDDALTKHLLLTGPSGVGKSVLMENLILQHIDRGGGVIVAEPKGDLVRALLAKIPEHRRADVVVLDPTSPYGIVGMNPLDGPGPAELRADGVLNVFTDMYGESLGVRSKDILHSCLLVLAQHPGASLVQIPRLLSDAAFRAQMVAPVANDPALADFWAYWESLSPTQQASVAAPLGNKLRSVILRKSIRTVIGQSRLLFDLRQVFTQNKIVLAPLPVATLGSEGSALLGSLLVSAAWDAARERALVPPEQRKLVLMCLDEFQQFNRLPDIEDALVTSRSYQFAWILAHQHEDQLTAGVKAAVRSSVRSRVAFQLAHDDATTFAKAATGAAYARPEADDFTALPAFGVYASLMEHGQVQPYASGMTLPPRPTLRDPDELLRESGQRYGRPIEEVEAEFTANGTTANGTATVADSVAGSAPDPAVPVPDSGVGRRSRRSTGRPTGHLNSNPANPPVDRDRGGDRGNASSPPGADLPHDPERTGPTGGRP